MRLLFSTFCPCVAKNTEEDEDTVALPVTKHISLSQSHDNSNPDDQKPENTLKVPFQRDNIKQDSLMHKLTPNFPLMVIVETERRDFRFNTPSFPNKGKIEVPNSAPSEPKNQLSQMGTLD
jgi:hypothetical protein